jgi:LAGLIDADG endonuclease
VDSDKPSGAENQQERLRQEGWVIGFVDGEGCFSIGFIRQNGGGGRTGYRTGYQVAHEFAVTQGAQSVSCLEELQGFFRGRARTCEQAARQPTVSTCIAMWSAGVRI